MKRRKLISAFLGLLLVTAAAGVSPGSAAGQESAAGTDPFAADPQPLTVAQCGQCHPSYFNDLKTNGGLHKQDCRNCHERFHAYNPVKNNWAELMPKCATCHETPHGAAMTDCLTCHVNPHTPRNIPLVSRLTSACGECHANPAKELKDFPSAHTKQGCLACHETHGFIPACQDCHAPHVEGQDQAACLACHQPHKPLQVTFNVPVDAATCGACHDGVFATWSKTASKHGQVNCADCHSRHGLIPECSSCHGAPHDQNLVAKFTGCLDCHLDVHDLPVKK